MRQVREVLRLKHECGLSNRAIGRALRISYTTAADYVHRAAVAACAGRCPTLWTTPSWSAGSSRRPKPAQPGATRWSGVHAELKRPGVTLRLLWEEYRNEQPDGYGYSRFCELYQLWRGRCPLSCASSIAPARSCSSTTRADRAGGRPGHGRGARGADLRRRVGASSYTYAEATLEPAASGLDRLPRAGLDFHRRGARGRGARQPEEPGSREACRYEPTINRTYADLAGALRRGSPAGACPEPRDKAKVEVGVQLVERWILARLRHRRFFSWPSSTTRSARWSTN